MNYIEVQKMRKEAGINLASLLKLFGRGAKTAPKMDLSRIVNSTKQQLGPNEWYKYYNKLIKSAPVVPNSTVTITPLPKEGWNWGDVDRFMKTLDQRGIKHLSPKDFM